MKRSDLIDLVYRFHPRGMHELSPGYDDTVERRRQQEAARCGAAEYARWRAVLRRLGGRYEIVDHSLCLLAGWCVVAYSGYVLLPGPTPGCGHTLGFHVSLLGPYYGIHRIGTPGEEEAALDIAWEIEAIYRGYETIPPEIGNEVVPDVGIFGKTTIYDCVFSDLWKTDSGPYQERSPDSVETEDEAADTDAPDDEDGPIHYHDVRM